MAQIMYPAYDHTLGFDVSTNPEIILMTAEGDEHEAEVEESTWAAGQAVTPPKSYNY